MANVSKMGQKLVSRLGCDKVDDVLACMRSKNAELIVKAADCKTGVSDEEGLFFAPVFDGWVLPKNPIKTFSGGEQHDVPIITGSTLNEGTLYLADEKDLSVAKYRSFLRPRFGDKSGEAFEMFPALNAEDVAGAIDKIITVGANAYPARFVAQSMENRKSKAYLYRFTRLPGTKMAQKLSVHHGADIAYVFGNMKKEDGYNDKDLVLSNQMMGYWVNFAITGDPNGNGLVYWPAYKKESDINLEFGDTVRTNQYLYKKEADFIEAISSYRHFE